MQIMAACPVDFAWFHQRTHWPLGPLATAIKAVDASGRIRGMVACDCFTPNSCHVHMAVDTPIAWRRLAPAVFIYLFLQLGLGVAVGLVRASNKASLGMARALGFRETHRIRDGWQPGEDFVVHELRREDCEAKATALARKRGSP